MATLIRGENMEFKMEQSVEILKQTPAALNVMLGGLSDDWLMKNEGPDTWSPFDVLGHLIHGERTDWIARIKNILEHGEARTFTPFDRFAMFEESRGKTVRQLLQTFETLRRENLETLEGLQLQPRQFELTGTHPELGRVTLGQLISTWTVHDLGHIYQISRTMAHQYDEAVGPWKKYLSVLK
jgi:hypothetical protein